MLKKRIIEILFLLSSAFALISAYIMEYRFGILPCKLCYYQRIIYFLSILFSLICIAKPKNFIITILITCYLINILIAGYQVAVEQHWVENLVSCVSEIDLNGLSDEEILDLTTSSDQIRCDIPQILILGISLAGWNMIYCCFVLSVYFHFRKKYEITIN